MQGVIMVAGPGAMKQVQPLWQEQKQWAFALDIAEGQANAHPALQLPSLPGLAGVAALHHISAAQLCPLL